ncbi:MAG: hypothetical protein C4325_10165 [Blastocatellia bacterium]
MIDDLRREVLAIEIDVNLGSGRMVRVLDRIAETRGLPERIRFDNGPKFTSIAARGLGRAGPASSSSS